MLSFTTMTLIRTLEALRKSKDGLNPIAFGWAMLLAIGWPVLGVALVVVSVSVILVACGKNPTTLVLACIDVTVHALSTTVPAIFGGWIMYTYLYLLIGAFTAAAIGRRYAIPLIWTRTCCALPGLRDKLAAVWRSITIPCNDVMPVFTGTERSPFSVQVRFLTPRACGWKASVNPQIR